jgi:ssDNA-binding replication factor A large subunit
LWGTLNAIKAALDDGTGALIVVLGKELTERLTGRRLEDYMRLVAELANPDAVRAEIMEKVIARPIEVGEREAERAGLKKKSSRASRRRSHRKSSG